MHRMPKFLREEALRHLLSALPGGHCFAPIDKPTGTDYVDAGGTLPNLRGPRPTSSIKAFFLPPREKVAAYWSSHWTPGESPFSVVGLRSCDLVSLRYLDRVFLGGVCEDPFYRARRAGAFLVSVDCVPPQEACFCSSVDGAPYAEDGFDLNLTPVNGGYVIEAGSARGAEVVDLLGGRLSPTSEVHLSERMNVRGEMIEALRSGAWESADLETLAGRLAGTEVDHAWEKWAACCVECGACTGVCPTCHCYYLIDTSSQESDAPPGAFAKVRTWDSCLLAEYARMAGAGAKVNPRPRLRSRLSNRILHKYVYSMAQYGMCGCLGCGRCDEACLGSLDIREMVTAVGGSR